MTDIPVLKSLEQWREEWRQYYRRWFEAAAEDFLNITEERA